MTNARAALILARISRLAAKATVDMAEGMHNPHFCAADATYYVASLKEDFQRLLDQLEPAPTAGSHP